MEQKSNNATTGIIIVILILVIGGYFLYRNSLKNKPTPTAGTPAVEVPTETSPINGDIGNIEQELDSINLDSLDQEI